MVENKKEKTVFFYSCTSKTVLVAFYFSNMDVKIPELFAIYSCTSRVFFLDLIECGLVISKHGKLMITNLDPFFFLGNEWSCFHGLGPNSSTLTLSWLLEAEESLDDSHETFCTKPKSNKWHQNATSNSRVVNVTVIRFVKFKKVRYWG